MYAYTINDMTDGERLCAVTETFKTPGNMRNLMKKDKFWKRGHIFTMSIVDLVDKRKMSFTHSGEGNIWNALAGDFYIQPNKEVYWMIN